MFCNNCHKNLEKFEKSLDDMDHCPLCGGVLIKEPKEVPQKSFESFCNELVKICGKDVFASDMSLFQKLENVEPCYVNARDKMSLLTIKQIPSRLYTSKDFPKDEIAYIINQCQKQLVIDLGVSFEICKEMLLALQNAIFGKAIPVPAYFVGDYFVDPRDGNKYKTVKIGEQIWMAENLRYECKGCSIYDNDYSKWAKYGYLYDKESLKSVAPDGWRVPTEQDFKELFTFVGKTSKINDWHKGLIAKDKAWGDNSTGTDEFGFSALPGGYHRSFYDSFDRGITESAYFQYDKGVIWLHLNQCSFYSGEYYSTSVRLIKKDPKQ